METIRYRNDIDGLRAIAVIAVIIFHLGYLPNGYLGVDVFFVISGFLITSIVYKESLGGKFSLWKFYERRIRRIIPLLLFMTTVAFVFGYIWMLPDDFENLCQSIFASNFSVNNILMYITSKDYWAVRNDYRPLMHTWSLGIEEQFYVIYPLIFLVLKGKRLKYALYALVGLALVSVTLFFRETNEGFRFFFIQYRFFELAVGGICALLFYQRQRFHPALKYVLFVAVLALVGVLLFPLLENTVAILVVTLLTALILVIGQEYFTSSGVYKAITTNAPMVLIGRISFSLYMWHQLVFAFARYAFVKEITPQLALLLIPGIVLLSLATYYGIENPFRNRKLLSTRTVLAVLGLVFVASSGSSLYVYSRGGIIQDYPSMEVYVDSVGDQRNFFNKEGNIHNLYNEKVRALDKGFEGADDRKRVLVIGNSYGRDMVNMLREYNTDGQLQIRYFDIDRLDYDSTIFSRMTDADVVFFAARDFLNKQYLNKIERGFGRSFAWEKIWVFGVKDFGYSNGIHYNHIRSTTDFTTYYAAMETGVVEVNEQLREEWGQRFVDLIGPIQNEEGKVRIFSDEGKFISQDTSHLTQAGARFYAKVLKDKLDAILNR